MLGAHLRRRTATAGVLLASAVVLAACSSPAGTNDTSESPAAGGGGLPDVIKIMSIRGLTGPVSFAGTSAQKGIDLALAEIEADGLLGDSTLEIDSRDAAASVQDGASLASQAAADPAYLAILGPEASAQSSAIAPIAENAGIPVAFIQSGSDGVVIGDYTFRITAPAPSYFGIVAPYLEEQGVQTAAVLFNSGNPTLTQLGETTVPDMATDIGFEIVDSAGVDTTAQDFTTPASNIAEANPDVAFLMLTGPQDAVAVPQLRQAGYDGLVIGMSAMGAGNLASAGDSATGAVWPADFSAESTAESTQAFVGAYAEMYDGEVPNAYAANGYDALWFLVRGIAEADSSDRAAIQQALAGVAAEGFAGAMGDLTFEGNDLRVPGILLTWTGSAEALLETGS